MENTALERWINLTFDSLSDLWSQILTFLPALLGAIVIVLIGLIVASVLERIVERLLFFLKIDSILKKAELEKYFQRANLRLNVGHFFGKLVYWFIVVGFVLAASDILRFTAFSDFLRRVLTFIPDAIIASLILLATMITANFLKGLVIAGITSAKLEYAHTIGLLVWWMTFIFGLLATLSQVGINVTILNTVITGVIAMLALAGGLSFGLGGKDYAHKFLSKMGEHMRK